MAKAKKAAMQMQAGNKEQRVAANAAQKMGAKEKARLVGIGENIVAQVIDSGDSVAAKYFALQGLTLAQLDAVYQGFEAAWTKALKKLKDDCREWAGKIEARDESSAYSKQAQVYYNKRSEGKAIFTMYRNIAEMPSKSAERKAIEKDVRDMEHAPRRYDTLVMYARHVNNPTKKGSSKPENAAVTRARNAWKNKTGEQVKKVKQSLTYANLAGLLELADWISDRISQLKKREKASVTKLDVMAKLKKAVKQQEKKAA